jgi:hypothetical protein
MSSSYFPYQPPPHIVQLSIQHINITKRISPSPSPPNGQSQSASAACPSLGFRRPSPNDITSAQRRCFPNEEARQTMIRTDFKYNLKQHGREYLKQYEGKELISHRQLTERQEYKVMGGEMAKVDLPRAWGKRGIRRSRRIGGGDVGCHELCEVS